MDHWLLAYYYYIYPLVTSLLLLLLLYPLVLRFVCVCREVFIVVIHVHHTRLG